MEDTMKYVYWLANLAFLALTIRFVCMYGSEWEFGRYCMPRSLVAPDGRTYANGREIDPITLALIRADREEETFLTMLGVLAGVIVVGGASIYRGHRHLLRLQHMGNLLAVADKYQREGRWNEAGELLRQYEALAGIRSGNDRAVSVGAVKCPPRNSSSS
jgi:hypothetical protein